MLAIRPDQRRDNRPARTAPPDVEETGTTSRRLAQDRARQQQDRQKVIAFNSEGARFFTSVKQ
ncbi:hypothetical protein [Streptomyces sp. CBMA123]|uniref:hypothetical protein n=1 Tax=Streptomyces sp. CBMA123 TaxID=1896313 RepID=UPI001661B81A|nr:hypothetical protein [Streptomyces sp. CBMA123]MBD0695074.1 hypothetical protein [Streptomyces sp. CBMA123]